MILSETLLAELTSDTHIHIDGFYLLWAERTKESAKRGRG